MAMQHWNNNFNEPHNHQRLHGNENERYHQADFNRNDNFNMPQRFENYNNPDYHNSNQNMYQQRGYSQQPNQDYFNQRMQNNEQNMRLHSGRHTEPEWDNLVNWAENVPDDNYRPQDNRRYNDNRMRNENQNRRYNNENNRLNTPNYGNAYNPQNRNYNPSFADDESGFSGGRRNANPDNEFDRDFGFENDNNFRNRHQQSWPENDNFDYNQHEGRNRWYSHSQNRNRHFGH